MTTHMIKGSFTFCGKELYEWVDGDLDRSDLRVPASLDRSQVDCQECLEQLGRSNAMWEARRAKYGETVPTHISVEIPIETPGFHGVTDTQEPG